MLTGWTVQGLNFGRVKRFFCFQKHSVRLLELTQRIFSGGWCGQRREVDHLAPSFAEVKSDRICTSASPVCFHGVNRATFTFSAYEYRCRSQPTPSASFSSWNSSLLSHCRPGQFLKGSKRSRLSEFVDSLRINVVRLSVLHESTGMIMSIKISKDTIGNRTRDLPVCSDVPQPTVPPRTLKFSSVQSVNCWQHKYIHT